MLRAELATAAAAVAAGPLAALPSAARALDAACRSAFGRGVDAADCVLTAQTRMGERMGVANALRPAMTPERLSALLSGAPRAVRLGAALLQTSDSDVDAAARMSAADGAAADAAAAAAAATADALHACGAVTAALLAAALALAPHADSAAPPPGDDAASGGEGSSEPPPPLRATVVLDELLRGAANAMRDTSLIARHVRSSPSGGAFLAVLAKWYALPDAEADAAARELRTGATLVLQTITAAGDGCALLWHGGAARSVVVERITLTLRAGAEAAARRPLKADEYSPARVGEAAALICNCTAAPEPGAAAGNASGSPSSDTSSPDAAAMAAGFASLFCAAGMPGALAALLVPRSALLRPRPDDAAALAIVMDALSRLAEHPEPRAALFPPRAAGTPAASSPAAALFVAMAAAAQHHPVAMAADQARESLRALAAAAAADVACTAALEGVLLVQRAPKGSAEGGQAMQLAPAVISAATQLSRAVGWDAWAPSYDDASSGGGSGRSSPCEAGLPCAACGAEAPRQGPPFQRCAACRRVAYCGKSCQVGAWGDHKRECQAAQAADAAAEGKAPPEKKKSGKK